MSESKTYGWVGLARKAGKIVAGDALCEDALARRRAYMIIVASDAGANTRERFTALCEKAGVDLVLFGTRSELGQRLGRDAYAVVAVLNRSFAGQIRKSMDIGIGDGKKSHGGDIVE
jgi:ribosomal protein L7Ae-like RNA K-turn-binding protein